MARFLLEANGEGETLVITVQESTNRQIRFLKRLCSSVAASMLPLSCARLRLYDKGQARPSSDQALHFRTIVSNQADLYSQRLLIEKIHNVSKSCDRAVCGRLRSAVKVYRAPTSGRGAKYVVLPIIPYQEKGVWWRL